MLNSTGQVLKRAAMLIAAAGLIAANAAAQSSAAKPATTKDERVWALKIQENYPAAALRYQLQGTVGVRVIVDTQGRVSQCFVTRSSGHAVLDEAACDGMVRFALFNPALDHAGLPTTGSYSTRISYRISPPKLPPADAPPVAPATVT